MSLTQPALRCSRVRAILVLAFAGVLLGGCAGVPGAQDASSTAAAAQPATDTAKVAAAVAAGVAAGNAAGARPGASPASVAQAAGAAAAAATGPKPFADVIKDAKETPGLFRVWQKDEKVWIEIAPEQFGVPYLFTSNLSRGVGEQGVYGGMMLGDQIVEFKRIGNNAQLIAKNHAFTGGANAPIAQGVKEGFTDSLLSARRCVVSLPHPERKSVLLDANALLLTDIPAGERFTTGIHMRNYTFDAKNSSFESVQQLGRPVVVRRLRALPESAGHAATGADGDAAAEPVPAVHHAARRPQPVPRLHVQLRAAAGADGSPSGGSPRRALRQRRSGISPPT